MKFVLLRSSAFVRNARKIVKKHSRDFVAMYRSISNPIENSQVKRRT